MYTKILDAKLNGLVMYTVNVDLGLRKDNSVDKH